LDGEVERTVKLLLVGFLTVTGISLDLLRRLIGRQDGPLLHRHLLLVRPVIAEVEVVVLLRLLGILRLGLLRLGLFRGLPFLVNSELRVCSDP
jgi:hypothetical protein